MNNLISEHADESALGTREVADVLVAQCGPQPWSPIGGGERLAAWLAPELASARADLVILSELSTTPFFSVTGDRGWLNAGETLDSPGLQALGRLAADAGSYIVVPFAERGAHGELYNSAVVLGPDGAPVVGTVCSGPRAGQPETTYRKVHLSENRSADPGVHEKYFFRPGDGFVTYDTAFGRIAILICYDRSFPEAWRSVRLAGARIVVVPAGSSRPERAAMFAQELRIGAVQNGVFAIAASKGGMEEIGDGAGAVTYFGASQVITPLGQTVAEGPFAEGPALVRAELDLDLFEQWERTYHLMRDRRPDAY